MFCDNQLGHLLLAHLGGGGIGGRWPKFYKFIPISVGCTLPILFFAQYFAFAGLKCVLWFSVSIGGIVQIDPTIYISVSKIIISQPTERHDEHHDD